MPPQHWGGGPGQRTHTAPARSLAAGGPGGAAACSTSLLAPPPQTPCPLQQRRAGWAPGWVAVPPPPKGIECAWVSASRSYPTSDLFQTHSLSVPLAGPSLWSPCPSSPTSSTPVPPRVPSGAASLLPPSAHLRPLHARAWQGPSCREPGSWPSKSRGDSLRGRRGLGGPVPSRQPGPFHGQQREAPDLPPLLMAAASIPPGLGRGAGSGQLRTHRQFSPETNGEKLLKRANSLCFRLIST